MSNPDSGSRQVVPEEKLIGEHPRSFADNWYVYPVLSRRAEGISIGVNLNRDKACNFNCIYCQVDRTDTGTAPEAIDIARLRAELEWVTDLALTGRIFECPPFDATPPKLRRLNDIAFSGDGEPTASPDFPTAVACAAEVRKKLGANDLKLLLITNASLLDKPAVQGALQVLYENNGEIWAKLDAGTEEQFRRVNRARFSLDHIVANILLVARSRPVVIQSLFMRVKGQEPTREEVLAYCDRLRFITSHGGSIKLVQVYTVARPPAESYVEPLPKATLEEIARQVAQSTGLETRCYA